MLTYIDNLSATRRALLIGAILLLGLSSLGYSALRIHRDGVPVVLETAPVDPRSMFQGDYVRLRYGISTLSGRLVEGEHRPLANATVYVELQPGQPVWTPVRASFSPLSPMPGHVVIRGMTEYASEDDLRVRYGIETFLVPEGDGRVIEQMGWSNRSRVTVRVLVAPDGSALPQNILVDGKPVFRDSGM